MPRPTTRVILSEAQRKQLQQWLAALGTPAGCTPLPYHSVGGRRQIRSSDCCREPHQPKNRSPLARTLQQSGFEDTVGDLSGQGEESDLRCRADQGGYRCHTAIETQGEYAVELPDHG